jgi:hypothetical protein
LIYILLHVSANHQEFRTIKKKQKDFHIHTVLLHLNIIKVFYSPTDAQLNCLKNNFKIYIKIDIKTAPTCFGAITPSSGSALLVLAKVTVFKK